MACNSTGAVKSGRAYQERVQNLVPAVRCGKRRSTLLHTSGREPKDARKGRDTDCGWRAAARTLLAHARLYKPPNSRYCTLNGASHKNKHFPPALGRLTSPQKQFLDKNLPRKVRNEWAPLNCGPVRAAPLNSRGSDPPELTTTQRRSSSGHPSRGPCAATASLHRAGKTVRTSCARSDGLPLRDAPTSGGRRRQDPRARDQVGTSSSGDPFVSSVNSSTSLCGAPAAAARCTATVYMPGRLWAGPTSAVTGGDGR